MKRTPKLMGRFALGALALLGVLALSVIFLLRSEWFKNEVRRRIVAQVETATGGKVEISRFDYHWKNLTADLYGFTIHGKETPPAEPLLQIEKAVIAVRVISVLERSANISSIVLIRPKVNIIVAPDGSTNFPVPPVMKSKDPIAQLFALKLNHFAITNGLAAVRDQRIPLNLQGDGVELTARYVKAGPSYDVTLDSEKVDFGVGEMTRGPLRLNARASFRQDSLDVPAIQLSGPGLRMAGGGKLIHFAHPAADFTLDASAAINEILPLVKFTWVRGGRVALNGTGHYDEVNGFSFRGPANARQIGVVAPPVRLEGVNVSAEVEAKKSGVVFRRILGGARAMKFEGEAAIKNYRELTFSGTLAGLSLREAASFITKQPIPWQGTISGPVQGSATLDLRARDLAVTAALKIAGAVSGAVDLRYAQKTNTLDFAKSHLNFPHSDLAFSGSLAGQNQVVLNSADLEDLHPAVALFGLQLPPDAWPVLAAGGKAHFDGVVSGLLSSVKFDGLAQANAVRVAGQTIDALTARFNASGGGLDLAALDLQQGDMRVTGTGLLGLSNWTLQPDSPLRAAVQLRGANLSKLAAQFPKIELPIIQGIASGTFQIRGTVGAPEGQAHISSDSLDAYGERLNQAQFDAELVGNKLTVAKGRVVSGGAVLSFSGEYVHKTSGWTSGTAAIHADTNGFPLASLSPVKKYFPAWNGQAELHFSASADVGPNRLSPKSANGTIELLNVTLNQVPYGNVTLRSVTKGDTVEALITGDFRKNPLQGSAKISLDSENRTTGEIDFERVDLETLYPLLHLETEPMFHGTMRAKLRADGSLNDWAAMRVSFISDKLELASKLTAETPGKPKAPAFVFRNSGLIEAELFGRQASIRRFSIEGDQTGLQVSGTVPLDSKKPLDLKVTGNLNLQAYHLIDPNVESAGLSSVNAAIGGTLAEPVVNGTLEVKNGSFFPANLANGLSEVNGVVSFTRDRATLQKMTAKSGGGQLALSGFLSFAGGGPLVYHLEGSAENVRVRYAGTISVTASSKLRLSGTSTNGLLAGTITVSRVIFNTNTDVGGLMQGLSAAAAAPVNENEFFSGLHLDIAIESAPNLQLSTALSRDVEAAINLRLRGTPEHPVLLGNLEANQGDIQAFGNRYTINRGEISFNNPVKIEPALDLDLETRARGVTVDITLSGTFSKLNIAYRSDPPLQPREIIALLSLGRAPDSTDVGKSPRTNDTNTLQSPANSLLGAAVTSPVTNRLSKLFGITNIRIDPLVQGITNTPQTRVTLEQQISKDITITYVTNLSQTSEQIFRFEWAFSRQFSVVALRDDNGEFGIDFQYKKQFK